MSPGRRFIPGTAFFLAIKLAAFSQSVTPPAPNPGEPAMPTNVRAELTKLLVADSKKITGVQQQEAPPTPAKAAAADAVFMSPYVVKEPKVPEIAEAVYETPLMRFLENGTLYSKVGKKVTTNVVLRFYNTSSTMGSPSMQGNVHPANGVQIGFFFSW